MTLRTLLARQRGAALALVVALPILVGSGCRRSDGPASLLPGENQVRRHGLSREDREVVARTALTVMARIATLRGRVRADQLQDAAADLEQARGLLGVIAATAPTFNLRERVRIARTHLSYEDAARVADELVPIRRELDGLAWLLPVREAGEHLQLARAALAKGDRDAASSDLQAMADAVIYQEIDLPLKDVDSDIVAAQQALQLRRLDEVDELLGRAESSLDVLTVWATGAQSQIATGASASD